MTSLNAYSSVRSLGECPKNRLVRTPDGEPGLNYLCPAFKKFFAHARPQSQKMANVLRGAS